MGDEVNEEKKTEAEEVIKEGELAIQGWDSHRINGVVGIYQILPSPFVRNENSMIDLLARYIYVPPIYARYVVQ